MKLFLKHIFHTPIYRVDVINWAIRNHKKFDGICDALYNGLKYFHIKKHNQLRLQFSDIYVIFPAFKYTIAERMFNAWVPRDPDNSFWWVAGDWVDGRLDYLNWLREKYKDDKTSLS